MICLCKERNEIYHRLSPKDLISLHLFHSYLHVHIHELLIKQGPPILLHFSVFKGGFHYTLYQLQTHLFQQLRLILIDHLTPHLLVFSCICTAQYISFSSVLIPNCWLFVLSVLHTYQLQQCFDPLLAGIFVVVFVLHTISASAAFWSLTCCFVVVFVLQTISDSAVW